MRKEVSFRFNSDLGRMSLIYSKKDSLQKIRCEYSILLCYTTKLHGTLLNFHDCVDQTVIIMHL